MRADKKIMESMNVKKLCSTCKKNSGVAICDGCQQRFCSKHFIEHRQELSQQADHIGQIHDVLIRDINETIPPNHSLFEKIDEWEQELIAKIESTAEVARANLREIVKNNRQNLKDSVSNFTKELQASREADDYTDIDINKWTQHIHELRKMFECSPTVYISGSNSTGSFLHLIEINTQPYQVPICSTAKSCINETFNSLHKTAELSEENHVATRMGSPWFDNVNVNGSNRYSIGIYHIRLRIEKVGDLSMFIGISSSDDTLLFLSKSTYGWWDLNETNTKSENVPNREDRMIKSGDDVTLTLNCDQQQIQLQHHRMNQSVQLKVDVNKCPFPWKLFIKLSNTDDSIRIL